MYKTVKRVMKVMMVGLVTMLGVQAEAHYVVVAGRCYWHSGQCVRQDEDVPRPPISDIPIGEIVARNVSGEVLCPPGSPQTIVPLVLGAGGFLVARKPIDPGDFTERWGLDNGIISYFSTNLEWERVISDAIFRENPVDPHDPLGDFDFCSGFTPRDVLIRSMSVQMNLYCVNNDPDPNSPTFCPSPSPPPGGVQQPHSTWRATCTLPSKFNFNNYPAKLPSRGTTPFDCSTIDTCHGTCEP